MKVVIEVTPTIIKSEDSDKFTISDLSKNYGAVISDADPFEAMRRYKLAWEVVAAFKTIMEFDNSKGKENNFYVAEFK